MLVTKTKGMNMSFTVLEDKVVIKIAQVEETTESGLYIPDSAAAMPETGVVVAVGPGRVTSNGTLLPTGISVGDTVVFSKRSAQKIVIEDEDYLVFLSDHILAIVEN